LQAIISNLLSNITKHKHAAETTAILSMHEAEKQNWSGQLAIVVVAVVAVDCN